MDKEWTKEWANSAPRRNGKFASKNEQPKSKPISLRFDAELYEWLASESERSGIKIRDLIQKCVKEKMISVKNPWN